MGTVTGSDARAIALIAHLVRDERSQDLVEYALLAAFIGIAGVAVMSILSTVMGTAYESSNAAAQDAWEPCPPVPQAC